jgi:hypothetical protein
LSPVRAQRSTARSSSANAPTLMGRRGILAELITRHCGTGIWRDRDIAAGWRDLETPCASLPTRSPSQPRTAAQKAGVLDTRKQLRERDRLSAGGKWIRTIGPPPEIVVDPSGSRRDHRAKYGCLSARPRVRCLCPPGKTQHLLPKSVFDRPGSDRWNLASTTFPDAGPMVRIRFPPAKSLLRTLNLSIRLS